MTVDNLEISMNNFRISKCSGQSRVSLERKQYQFWHTNWWVDMSSCGILVFSPPLPMIAGTTSVLPMICMSRHCQWCLWEPHFVLEICLKPCMLWRWCHNFNTHGLSVRIVASPSWSQSKNPSFWTFWHYPKDNGGQKRSCAVIQNQKQMTAFCVESPA